MRDGRRLSARLWRPLTDGPVGVVLTYEPYPHGWITQMVDAAAASALTAAGYAFARVDLAGSGDSDGLLCDEYLASEHDDAVEVIEWLADQPWCNGRVGIRGLSWSGFNALQIAARRPAALRAVVSACSTDDRYVDDVHYMGGSVLAHDMQRWATWAHLFFVTPPDPEVVGETWKDRWVERLEKVSPVVETWLTHQRRDEYWRHGSVGDDIDAIECPLLLVGGWEDGYRDALLRMLAARPKRTWAVLGPWGHGWPSWTAPGPNIDWFDFEARWWRRWLDDDDAALDEIPAVRVYLQDSRRPSEHLLHRPGWWLSCESSTLEARARTFSGSTSRQAGETLAVTRHPTQGMHAPVWCPEGAADDFALDQRQEDAVSACIDWELAEGVALLGRPVARVALRADQPRVQVVARLCDVAPDGSSTLVAMGALHTTVTSASIRVPMRATGYVVPASHRLRLAISPGYWPMLWPLPSIATIEVDVDGCELDLPLAPDLAVTSTVGPLPPLPARAPRRRAEQVFGTSEVVVRRVTNSGIQHTDDGSTWRVGDNTSWSTSDDPLTSTTTTTVVMERSRGGWSARWEAASTMTADAEHFHVEVAVTAEADGPVFDRVYRFTIARDQA
jgi:putative CocE/NonD family hydrolase